MLGLIIANRKLIGITAALFTAALFGGYINGLRWESKLKSELLGQEALLLGQCAADKAKTERIDHELQSKVTELSKRVAAYKLRKPPACVHVTNAASSNDGSPRSGLVGTDAINSESLTDYAELAETYRLRLVSCQNFIRLERIR